MRFSEAFSQFPIHQWLKRSLFAAESDVRSVLKRDQLTLGDFATLIAPAGATLLEPMSQRSHVLTHKRFGKVMRFYAPLYLSNECVNNCKYCGFSRDNPILRVTLSIEEVLREARALHAQGFRNLLLVSGEHPKFASNHYIADCVAALRDEIPGIALEVGPMETADYQKMVDAGAESLVVYQETYDRSVYTEVHTSGPKRDFDWRLDTAQRAYAAGFRRLGIGALYGLSDWRVEALAVAAHALHLLRHCWKSQLTISFPRLRPHAGEFEPLTHMSDADLVQLICAFRLLLPDVGLVLSTREPAKLRDGLIPLGITHLSAGSHTEPGGYTGAGSDNLHLTTRGRIEPLSESTSEATCGSMNATRQFDIADDRSPKEVAHMVRSLGYEPVWKDWDVAILGA